MAHRDSQLCEFNLLVSHTTTTNTESMVALPRRWLRQLTYTATFLVFASVLVLIANKNRIVHLDRYIPTGLMPQYFQPPSDAYVVDVVIGSCSFLNVNAPNCGQPEPQDGLYGDVGEHGSWVSVQKDLLLGSLWVSRAFLYSKMVHPDYFDTHRDAKAIHVVWVSTQKDCEIRGNTECVPLGVLKEFLKSHPFDDEDQKKLLEANKDTKLRVDTDPEKSAKKYNSDFVKSKEEKANEATNQEEAEAQNDAANRLARRTVETSRHNLKNYMVIPTMDQLEAAGWKKLGNGIWAKYGPPDSRAITGVDILFGPDAVDPRPNWNLLPNALVNTGAPTHMLPRLSIRVGPRMDYKSSEFQPRLKFNKEGKFKVLQVADLHFSTGVGKCRDPAPAESGNQCEADPRTLRFLLQVLDIEKPDFVVLTGDQVFGDAAPDPETALFKAVLEFVSRKIPYAITLGNHDDESSMSRLQMMNLASGLPFSVAGVGPEEVDGFGNYAITIEGSRSKDAAAAFYFLDSHSRSKNQKVNPGYDWFKDSQINWVGMEAESIFASSHKNKDQLLSMAFFHIPLPEFADVNNKPMVGQQREGVASSRYHTEILHAFRQVGILVASVGHDHVNDYCVFNKDSDDSEFHHNLWLCYGGGAGEGGYGGYGEYIRRMRVYELDQTTQDINTWKRAENDPGLQFDVQKVVGGGKAVDHV